MNVHPMQGEYTPEDLLAMPDGKGFELVNGRLVECPRRRRPDRGTVSPYRREGW